MKLFSKTTNILHDHFLMISTPYLAVVQLFSLFFFFLDLGGCKGFGVWQTKSPINGLISHVQVVGYGEIGVHYLSQCLFNGNRISHQMVRRGSLIQKPWWFTPMPCKLWEPKQMLLIQGNRAKLNITQGFWSFMTTIFTTPFGPEGFRLYSAAIFSYWLNGKRRWTYGKMYQGFWTTDPDIFEKRIVNKFAYRELIELAFYGSFRNTSQTLQPLQKGRNAFCTVKILVSILGQGT